MKRDQRKVFFSLLFFLWAWSGILQAQTVTVTIPNVGAPAGKDVNVDIQVSDLTGLQVFSMDFKLLYDSSILQYLAVTSSGTITSSWGAPTVNNIPGQISVAFAGVDPLAGSGKLIRVQFHVLETAGTGSTAQLSFLSFQFNEGQPGVTTQTGSVTVIADQEAPRIISGPSIVERQYHSVKVFLKTDEPSSVTIDYGETTSYGNTVSDPNFSTTHTLQLPNLRETTDYHYMVGVTDSLGNGPRFSSDVPFSTRQVFLELPRLTADPGTAVEIPVTVPDLSGLNITKVELEISYNPFQLQVSGINTRNTVLSAWPAPSVTISSGSLVLTATDNTPLQGGGNLFVMTGNIPTDASLNMTSNLLWRRAALNNGAVRIVIRDGSLTVKDRIAPIIISGPDVSAVGSQSATIQWQTNEPSTSFIDYGESITYAFHRQKEELVLEHEFRLTGLIPGRLYHFRVGGRDASGNGPSWSSDVNFSTSAAEVQISLLDTTAAPGSELWMPLYTTDLKNYSIVSWNALLAFDPDRFEYLGTRQNNTLTQNWNPVQVSVLNGFLALSASGTSALTGGGKLLQIGFRVKSVANSLTTTLEVLSFLFDGGWPTTELRSSKVTITGAQDQIPPKILWGPFVDQISSNSARVYWRSDEKATAAVEFGTTRSYGQLVESSRLDTVHQVILTNLNPGTGYHYRVRNRDGAGNWSTFSADSQFTTLPGNSIQVTIPVGQAAPGSVIDLPIQVGDVTGKEVYSCDISVKYDPSQLTAVSVTSSGALASTWGDPVYSLFPGEVVVAMGGIQALTGSGNLIKIRFRVQNTAPAGSFLLVRFQSFIFNEGTPLATFRFGGIRVLDQISPHIISGPDVLSIKTNSATITWRTDEPADSRVYFGVNSTNESVITDNTLHWFHMLPLDGLLPNTTYHYRISSQDSVGNSWTSSQTYEFTTAGIEALRFQVANRKADVNQTIAVPVTVTGNTARPIFSLRFRVLFDTAILKYQSIQLTAPNTQNWQVTSQEIVSGEMEFQLHGNQPVAVEGELLRFIFLTRQQNYGAQSNIELKNMLANNDSTNIFLEGGLFELVDQTLPAFVLSPAASQIREKSANISWQTDEPCIAWLVYGPTGGQLDTVSISQPSTSFSQDLTNLTPMTTYRFRVGITDLNGNGPLWSEFDQFTTTAGNEVEILFPDTSFAIGDTALIPLRIGASPVIDILRYQFRLVLPSQLVQLLSLERGGTLTRSWPAPSVSVNQDTLTVFHSGSQGIQQPGVLLYLRVTILPGAHHNQKIGLRLFNFVFNNGAPPAAVTNGSLQFLDLSPPVFIVPPEVLAVRLKSVQLKITTDEPSRLIVHYGKNTSLDSLMKIDELDTVHIFDISGLIPNQSYTYQIEATDSLGNGPSISERRQFQTLKAVVHLTIPDSSARIGSEISIPVFVSDLTDFGITSYEVQIQYDPDLLTVLGVSTAGTLSEQWGNGTFSSSGSLITFSHQGTQPLSGIGVLFWLRLRVAKNAQVGISTQIQFSSTVFQNHLFPVETTGGSLRFEAPITTKNVQVSLPELQVPPGASVEVEITVSEVSGLGVQTYSFILQYDHHLLDLTGVKSTGTLTQNWGTPGVYHVGDSLFVSHSGSVELTGTGDLLILQFNLSAGAVAGSRIDLRFREFTFNEGAPRAVVGTGSITVIGKPSTIPGYVRDARTPQIGIADARIQALSPSGGIAAQTTSDDSGHFELSNLDWQQKYSVFAWKDGYSPSDTLHDLAPTYTPLELFLLKQDGVIEGKIVDGKGERVAGALISVNDFHQHFGSANSDQNGEFRIEKLDRRFPYQVVVSRTGFASVTLQNVVVDSFLNITLYRQYGKIYGRTFTMENQPLAQVVIKFFYQQTGEQVAEQLSGADGSFVQDSLIASSYLVIAQKEGFISTPKQQLVNLAPQQAQRIEFHLKPFQLQSIQITGDFFVPNDQPTQFSYTALSSSGETVDQLSNLEWFLLPEMAGTIQNGKLFPDSTYIGQASIIAKALPSNIADTASIFLYANIQADKSYSLHDSQGMELTIPVHSVVSAFQLKFDSSEPQSIKRSTRRHLVVGRGYDLKPDGQQFLQPILLRLPVPEAYRHAELLVGEWNPNRAEWTILPESRKVAGDKIEVAVEHFSLFALLYRSKPLGIDQVQFIPNPFSPRVDSDGDGIYGLVIRFKVSSNTIRQPFVSVRIYSLLGEMMQEIVRNKPLDKGVIHSFVWDGKTELGREARNGRYLVQIEAKDAQGIKTYLGQVVLIK